MKSIFCIVLLLLLTACQTPLVSDLSKSGDRLFWDDFSDPSGNWPQVSGTDGSLAYAQGAYRITIHLPNYELWAFSGHAYRDVHVDVDAVRLAGPLENLIGLTCRSRDANNYYFFIISSDGYYGIGKVRDGAASLLGQEMMAYSPAILQGDELNHLRFNCIGQALTGSVNDQAIASTQDSDFSSGDAGLLAGAFSEAGVDVFFDNFVVTKP
jgi:hypothetical protein